MTTCSLELLDSFLLLSVIIEMNINPCAVEMLQALVKQVQNDMPYFQRTIEMLHGVTFRKV